MKLDADAGPAIRGAHSMEILKGKVLFSPPVVELGIEADLVPHLVRRSHPPQERPGDFFQLQALTGTSKCLISKSKTALVLIPGPWKCDRPMGPVCP